MVTCAGPALQDASLHMVLAAAEAYHDEVGGSGSVHGLARSLSERLPATDAEVYVCKNNIDGTRSGSAVRHSWSEDHSFVVVCTGGMAGS